MANLKNRSSSSVLLYVSINFLNLSTKFHSFVGHSLLNNLFQNFEAQKKDHISLNGLANDDTKLTSQATSFHSW
jgi:hypothetical protein